MLACAVVTLVAVDSPSASGSIPMCSRVDLEAYLCDSVAVATSTIFFSGIIYKQVSKSILGCVIVICDQSSRREQ